MSRPDRMDESIERRGADQAPDHTALATARGHDQLGKLVLESALLLYGPCGDLGIIAAEPEPERPGQQTRKTEP